MNRSKGIFVGSTVIPAAIGILVLVMIAFIFGPGGVNVDGAQFYNVQSVAGEKTTGQFLGAVSNGDVMADGDVINITAINSSAPSPIPTEDLLVIDIIVNNSAGERQYWITWDLTYNGTGAEFTGDITIDSDLGQNYQYSTGDITLKAGDGDMVTLRKNNTNDAPLLYFLVDAKAPTVSTVEPGSGFATISQVTYAKSGSRLNFTISDVSSDQQWFVDNNRANYSWDGGSATIWDGNAIAVPGSFGNHTVNFTAVDIFGQTTSLVKTYNVTNFISNSLPDNITITSGRVLMTTTEVEDGLTLTIRNSEILFLGYDDELSILEGGSLVIDNSTIGSTGEQYTISSEDGADLDITDSEIYGATLASSNSAILSLEEGYLNNVTFYDITNMISILSPGVDILHSNLELEGSGTIDISMEHAWDTTPTRLMNLSINGTSWTPISISNVSTWTPYDVSTRYYEDDTSGTIRFYIDTTNMTDPYLKLPFFIDSRTPSGIFDMEYNVSGIWHSFPGFPVGNTVFEEWVNGDDAMLDLSGFDEGPLQLRATWTATAEDIGSVYLGNPLLGNNQGEISPGSPSFSWDHSKWGTIAKGDVLVLKNITIENATTSFIEVISSGDVSISEITIGDPDIYPEANDLIKITDSSVMIINTDLHGSSDTQYGIMLDLDNENDWIFSHIKRLNLSINGTEKMDAGIRSMGGRISVENGFIENCIIGIEVNDGLLNTMIVDTVADDIGVYVSLPASYPMDVTMDIESITASSNYEIAGIFLQGNNLDYDLDLMLSSFEVYSNNQTTYVRGDGIGGIILDLTSNNPAIATINGNVTKGNGHGIAIPNWPTNGRIYIKDSLINQVALDGIYLGDGLKVNITNTEIQRSDSGIYAGDNIELGMMPGGGTNTLSNVGGGIRLGDSPELHIQGVDISFCSGTGISLGIDAVGTIRDVNIYLATSGLTIKEGSEIEIYGLKVESSTLGYGIFAKDSDLTMAKGGAINKIINNNGAGILIEGGALSIERTWIDNNTGKGLYLDGVDLASMKDVKIRKNRDDGLTIHIDSNSLLDVNGYYGKINNTEVSDNIGTGLAITFNPAQVTRPIEVDLQGPIIGGNPGGDIISPFRVHILWTSATTGVDKLGSLTQTGIIRANMDVEVGELSDAEIMNLNITLLGNSNSFHISELGTLRMSNCYIRPSQTNNRFSITGGHRSTIIINGGYLGQLYKLEVKDGDDFVMDGTLVRYSAGPIRLESTPMTIEDSEFSNIEGTALLVIDGEGSISGSKFKDNTKGLEVEGLEDDLDIVDCEFIDNNWGISLFNDSSQTVSIVDSYFSGNSPASIWTATAYARVLDSYIDPYSIQVSKSGYSVTISYTLKVALLDELDMNVEFDITIERGVDIITRTGIGGKFSETFESYSVGFNAVNMDRLGVDLSIKYEEGVDDLGNPMFNEITDSFDLDRAFSVTYYGYQAPTWTELAPRTEDLLADEDIGLKFGAVDVDPWFKDIGTDQGNLTFTVQKLTPQIMPYLEGTMLDLRLEKDWNGRGTISVTATDPHGVSYTLFVSINVLEKNDQPMVTNPRIIALNSDSPTVPRTHDTIKGVWEWYDVDGDREPLGHIIHWYLNGTRMLRYDNEISVSDVYAGQIWNFTIYPADNLGISGGIYGEPAHSPPIMIGNIPPRLNSVTITTKNPTTLTDLLASPGYWEDPETNVVTFNYLWEKKTQTGYEPLGAPNSPVLDHRFTSRGETIRVKVWVSDGVSISEVRTDEVYIRNSAPYISTAKLMPVLVDENTDRIYIEDLVWGDPDGDMVTISYQWFVRGWPIAIADTWSEIQKSEGNWNHPANISVLITPYDSNNLPGTPYYLEVYVTPTDTDGDGKFDDANGNGRNDLNDDKDDDGDGFNDEWEELLGTDPKDRFDKPKDSDGDGLPDGDDKNSELWMDIDDDNDGVWDIHPNNVDMNAPVWYDTFPKTASLPGDMDYDGIGNDQDPDIDGDGYLNEDDYAPMDPNIHSAPKEEKSNWIQVLTLLLVILIIAAILVFVYLVYNGTITLPSQAPPPVSGGGAEAIYDDDEPGVAKLPPKADELDEMEELEGMSICSNCGELVSVEEPMCPNCGSEFEELEEEDEDEVLDFDDDDDDDD